MCKVIFLCFTCNEHVVLEWRTLSPKGNGIDFERISDEIVPVPIPVPEQWHSWYYLLLPVRYVQWMINDPTNKLADVVWIRPIRNIKSKICTMNCY